MIRDYQETDFENCQKLVNEVWEFDKHFQPIELSVFLQMLYTGSSLSESNFKKVVDENGDIEGFLFGKIENIPIPKSEFSGFWGTIKIIKGLLFIHGVRLKRKLSLMSIANTHEVNRREIESRQPSEVNLFVVSPRSQGKGWGKKLINEFIQQCKAVKSERIVLETDSESNFGFYRHMGFSIKGSFYSPLLQEYTGSDGKTYIYELILRT